MAGCETTACARWGRPIDLPCAARSLQQGLVELVAELADRLGHRLGAPLAVCAVVAQPLAQARVEIVDQVAEHVQVRVTDADRRDLDRRHQPDAVLGRGAGGLLDAVDRVVV